MLKKIDRKGYFFDLDGTLVDSSPGHAHAFKEVLAKYCPGMGKGFNYENYKGIATPEVFERLGIKGRREIDFLTRQKRRLYLDQIRNKKIPVFPGSHDLFELLHSKGKKINIVTSASKESAQAILKTTGLSAYIDKLVTSEDVNRGKPYPDIFLLALIKSKISNKDAVVIEDSISGKISAEKAGIDCLLINSTSADFINMEQLYLYIKNELN